MTSEKLPGISEIMKSLLPMTAEVNSDEHLSIGGCDLTELAAEFGTPLYIYDEVTIRQMCRQFMAGFRDEYEATRVTYASKAFTNPSLLRIIMEEGLGLDVVTGGELAFAKAVEFTPGEISFHGNNKSGSELEEALAYGVRHVVLDGLSEMDLLNDIASESGVQQEVLLRLSPNVDPHTHRLTTTGILDSKFGFPMETGAAEQAVQKVITGLSHLKLTGLHFHLGSPIFELEPYVEAIDCVMDFAKDMQEKYGLELREFSPGGGFAIGYVGDSLPPNVRDYAIAITGAVRRKCAQLGLEEPILTIEPGRAIVGRGGVALYTVGTVKEIPDVRTYVAVDGGMGDNIRPALYNAGYTVFSADRPLERSTDRVTVVGKFCESGDVLASEVFVPRQVRGGLLAVPAAGAYCMAMASNYNMVPRPAVVMVNNSNARLIRRRESYPDIMAASLV